MIRIAFITTALLQAYLSLATSAEDQGSSFIAPGRSTRMLNKRQGTDFGTFQVDCVNSESACNNACFYIYCVASSDPDANLITYTGGDQMGKDMQAKNRRESGCQVQNPAPASGSSMCTNFPFSQKWSDPTAMDWQCDEWPPALSQQPDYGSKKFKNSLRCMPGGENGSLGGKLGAFIQSNDIDRDDFFRVDFATKIGTADPAKVPYCLTQNSPSIRCVQDGFQIGMTEKQVGGGKIESPYWLSGDNNKYSWQNTPYTELYECSIEIRREGDGDFKNIKLFDYQNTQKGGVQTCTLDNDGDTCTVTGLPKDLQIKRTGAFKTRLEFEYAVGETQNANHYTFDSDETGNGRGPATNDGDPYRYCKVVDDGASAQNFECWFPCFKSADGR